MNSPPAPKRGLADPVRSPQEAALDIAERAFDEIVAGAWNPRTIASKAAAHIRTLRTLRRQQSP